MKRPYILLICVFINVIFSGSNAENLINQTSAEFKSQPRTFTPTATMSKSTKLNSDNLANQGYELLNFEDQHIVVSN